MVEHKFNNEYDIILHALSLLLDHFEKDDQLFAAQWIWWLASIIQFTEILTYYRHYKIFPSDFITDLVVALLPTGVPDEDFIPEHQQKMKWHSQYSEHFEIQVRLFSIMLCTLAGNILSKIVFISLWDFQTWYSIPKGV